MAKESSGGGGCLKRIFVTVLLLSVILLVIGIIGSSLEGEEASKEISVNVNGTEVVITTTPKPTETPKPTDAPEPTEVPEGIVASCTISYSTDELPVIETATMDVVITKVERTDSVATGKYSDGEVYATVTAKGVFYVVHFQATNRSSMPLRFPTELGNVALGYTGTIVMGIQGREVLYTKNENVTSSVQIANDMPMSSEELQPDITYDMIWVFELPPDASNVGIQVKGCGAVAVPD